VADSVDWGIQWDQIVARAWADDAFKQRLLADPAAVLKEYGVAPPAGVTIKVHESTDKVLNLTLPPKPGLEELSVEEVQRVVGGTGSLWLGGGSEGIARACGSSACGRACG
jgi:hypothetical protein